MGINSKEQNSEFDDTTRPLVETRKRTILKKILYIFIGGFLVFSLAAVAVSWYAWKQLDLFTQAANISPQVLWSQIEQGLNISTDMYEDSMNLLVLGVDSLDTRPGSPPLTDTILLISVIPSKSEINLLSLPRDLWSDPYQTRVNALYFYGLERYPDQPEKFTTEVLEELLDIKIHHTVVVSLESVQNIVNEIGGVDITIPQGFTDTQFPRSDVDVTKVSDPKMLYETVTFEAGEQTLNADQALKYMRSRHSSDDLGTDISRSQRQQTILKSIGEKITSNEIAGNPKKLGNLFYLYQSNFSQYISLPEIIGALKFIGEFEPESFHINTETLSIFPEQKDGVIVNPPTKETQGEWIYRIKDLENFKQEVHKKLGIPIRSTQDEQY